MNDSEIQKLKEELMKPDWTENLHHELENLQPVDAIKFVESMNNSEIYQKVNVRKFQQDYIADYLEYLWEISETAFWRHVIITLDLREGFLWSDNMFHFEKMCNVKIPKDVLTAVLDFAIECDEKSKYDIEIIGCVIKAQVNNFERLAEIRKHISLLEGDKQDIANKRINEMIKRKCNY